MPKEKTGPKSEKEFIRTSDKLSLAPQRLSEFRKLAEIPLPNFKERNADSERFMLDVVQVEVYNAERDT